MVQSGEECDDGNDTDGDECSNDCADNKSEQLVNGNFDEEILRSRFLRGCRPESPSRPVRCESFRWKGNTVIAKLAAMAAAI